MNLHAHPRYHSPRSYPDIRCDEDGLREGSPGYGKGAAKREALRDARVAACNGHLADMIREHPAVAQPNPIYPPREEASSPPEPPPELTRRRGVLLRPNFDNPAIATVLADISARVRMVRETYPDETPRLLISEVIAVVGAGYGLPPDAVAGKRRWIEYIRPRHVAMFVARVLTRHSLPLIGRAFGHADHTTVIHAMDRIGNLRRFNPDVASDLSRLIALMEGALCHA